MTSSELLAEERGVRGVEHPPELSGLQNCGVMQELQETRAFDIYTPDSVPILNSKHLRTLQLEANKTT